MPDPLPTPPIEADPTSLVVTDAFEDRVLAFERGGVVYTVAAESVRGVAPRTRVTRVPGTPPSLRGVMAWRGAVIPIVEPGEPVAVLCSAVVIVTGECGDMALAANAVQGWKARNDAPAPLDIDVMQQRLRDRIRRGPDAEPAENS